MENTSAVAARPSYLVLLLLKRRSRFLVELLERSGYASGEALSPDHLVALCLNNPVKAVIVDMCQLGEIEGWSLPQSIKMINPSVSVIVLCHGMPPKRVQLPTAVDALATDSDLAGLLAVLNGHIGQKCLSRSIVESASSA